MPQATIQARPTPCPDAGRPNATARQDSKDPVDSKGEGVPNDVKALTRWVSILPGGCFKEITYGIQELKGQGAQGMSEHHVKDGVVDILKGVSATFGFLSHLPIYTAAAMGLFHATVPAFIKVCLPIATPIAGAAGIIETVLDGGRDVYEGIKDKDAKLGVIGGIKTLAGAIGTVGAVTVNPILIGASTAITLGVIAYQNWDGVKQGVRLAYDKVTHLGHKEPQQPAS